jgi:hypothetical protein
MQQELEANKRTNEKHEHQSTLKMAPSVTRKFAMEQESVTHSPQRGTSTASVMLNSKLHARIHLHGD